MSLAFILLTSVSHDVRPNDCDLPANINGIVRYTRRSTRRAGGVVTAHGSDVYGRPRCGWIAQVQGGVRADMRADGYVKRLYEYRVFSSLCSGCIDGKASKCLLTVQRAVA